MAKFTKNKVAKFQEGGTIEKYTPSIEQEDFTEGFGTFNFEDAEQAILSDDTITPSRKSALHRRLKRAVRDNRGAQRIGVRKDDKGLAWGWTEDEANVGKKGGVSDQDRKGGFGGKGLLGASGSLYDELYDYMVQKNFVKFDEQERTIPVVTEETPEVSDTDGDNATTADATTDAAAEGDGPDQISFDQAFAMAKEAGLETFEWQGKSYTTQEASGTKPQTGGATAEGTAEAVAEQAATEQAAEEQIAAEQAEQEVVPEEETEAQLVSKDKGGFDVYKKGNKYFRKIGDFEVPFKNPYAAYLSSPDLENEEALQAIKDKAVVKKGDEYLYTSSDGSIYATDKYGKNTRKEYYGWAKVGLRDELSKARVPSIMKRAKSNIKEGTVIRDDGSTLYRFVGGTVIQFDKASGSARIPSGYKPPQHRGRFSGTTISDPLRELTEQDKAAMLDDYMKIEKKFLGGLITNIGSKILPALGKAAPALGQQLLGGEGGKAIGQAAGDLINKATSPAGTQQENATVQGGNEVIIDGVAYVPRSGQQGINSINLDVETPDYNKQFNLNQAPAYAAPKVQTYQMAPKFTGTKPQSAIGAPTLPTTLDRVETPKTQEQISRENTVGPRSGDGSTPPVVEESKNAVGLGPVMKYLATKPFKVEPATMQKLKYTPGSVTSVKGISQDAVNTAKRTFAEQTGSALPQSADRRTQIANTVAKSTAAKDLATNLTSADLEERRRTESMRKQDENRNLQEQRRVDATNAQVDFQNESAQVVADASFKQAKQQRDADLIMGMYSDNLKRKGQIDSVEAMGAHNAYQTLAKNSYDSLVVATDKLKDAKLTGDPDTIAAAQQEFDTALNTYKELPTEQTAKMKILAEKHAGRGAIKIGNLNLNFLGLGRK